MLPVKEDDLQALRSVLDTGLFAKPNLKISVYKNRRGRYKGIYLWCYADLSICRIKPMFCTDFSYQIMEIKDLEILVEEETSFEKGENNEQSS